MKTGYFILITVIIAALFATVSCGGGRRTAEGATDEGFTAGQVIALSDSLMTVRRADTVAFGRVGEGEVVSKRIGLRNDSGKPFVITGMDLTCGCIEVDYPKQPLKDGDQAAMTVSFDSRGIRGWVYKTVLMYTSLSGNAYTIVVTADVE